MRLFGKREATEAEEPVADPVSPAPDQEPVTTGGRTAAAWTAVAIGVILAVALIVFLAQNTRKTEVTFLGFSGSVPVAIALLAAAVLGAAVVLVVGTARVTKLRLAAREFRRRDADRQV
jgi:uncharacterized integral membrane protein